MSQYNPKVKVLKTKGLSKPQSRKLHTITSLNKNIILLFGGITDSSNKTNIKFCSDILYAYNTTTTIWNVVKPLNSKPEQLYDHSASTLDDDSNIMFVFGGVGSKTNKCTNNLWMFTLDRENCKKGTWELIENVSTNNIDKTNVPSPRAGHTSCVYDNKIWIFGGYDNNNNKNNELWCYCLNDERWINKTMLSKTNNSKTNKKHLNPECRSGHSTVIKNESMYILGGTDNNNNQLNDVWAYRFKTSKWEHLSSKVKQNGNNGLIGHKSLNHNNTVYVLGGITDDPNSFIVSVLDSEEKLKANKLIDALNENKDVMDYTKKSSSKQFDEDEEYMEQLKRIGNIITVSSNSSILSSSSLSSTKEKTNATMFQLEDMISQIDSLDSKDIDKKDNKYTDSNLNNDNRKSDHKEDNIVFSRMTDLENDVEENKSMKHYSSSIDLSQLDKDLELMEKSDISFSNKEDKKEINNRLQQQTNLNTKLNTELKNLFDTQNRIENTQNENKEGFFDRFKKFINIKTTPTTPAPLETKALPLTSKTPDLERPNSRSSSLKFNIQREVIDVRRTSTFNGFTKNSNNINKEYPTSPLNRKKSHKTIFTNINSSNTENSNNQNYEISITKQNNLSDTSPSLSSNFGVTIDNINDNKQSVIMSESTHNNNRSTKNEALDNRKVVYINNQEFSCLKNNDIEDNASNKMSINHNKSGSLENKETSFRLTLQNTNNNTVLLSDIIRQLKNKLDDLKIKYNDTVELTSNEVSDLNQLYEKSLENFAYLKIKIISSQGNTKDQSRMDDKNEHKIDILEEQLVKMRGQNLVLKNQKLAQNSLIENTKKQIESISKQHSRILQISQDVDNTTKTLNNNKSILNIESNEETLEKQVRLLKKEIKNKDNEIGNLNLQLQAQESNIKNKETTIQTLKKVQNIKNEKIVTMEDLISDLETKNKNLIDENTILKKDNSEYKNDVENLKIKLENIESMYSYTKEEYDLIKHITKDPMNIIDKTAMSELVSYKQIVQDSNLIISELKQTIQRLNEEKDKCERTSASNNSSIITESKEYVKNMNRKYATIKQKLIELEREMFDDKRLVVYLEQELIVKDKKLNMTNVNINELKRRNRALLAVISRVTNGQFIETGLDGYCVSTEEIDNMQRFFIENTQNSSSKAFSKEHLKRVKAILNTYSDSCLNNNMSSNSNISSTHTNFSKNIKHPNNNKSFVGELRSIEGDIIECQKKANIAYQMASAF